jgi:hypothetical protein
MKIVKLNCTSCGAPISVPEDLDILFCNSCGSKLAVDRGEGYVALKLVEKLAQAVQESGEKAHSAIKENTFVTKTELKKVQLSQSISTEEMKLNSLRQEIRTLTRSVQPTYVMRTQLTNLRLDECNSLMHIRKLNLDMAKLDEGWDESLEVFQNDLASLNEIITILSPFTLDPKIAARIAELKKEQERAQAELITLETRIITKQLKSSKYPPLKTLNLDQLDALRSDIQQDMEFLLKGPQTEVKTRVKAELNGLSTNLNAIYPRKKVESSIGELKSLDLVSPFPAVPAQLIPLIELAEADLGKVIDAPDSPSKILVKTEIEKLLNQLRTVQAKGIPSQKTFKTSGNKRSLALLIVGFLAVIAVVVLGVVFMKQLVGDLIPFTVKSTASDFFLQQTRLPGEYKEATANYLEILAQKTYLRAESNIDSQELAPVNNRDLVINLGQVGQAQDWYKVKLVDANTTGYLYQPWVNPVHGQSQIGTPARKSTGGKLYSQEFSSPGNWLENTFDESFGTGSLKVSSGSYRIELNSKIPSYYFSNVEVTEFPSRYSISVDLERLSGNGSGYYGLQTNIVDDTHFDFVMLSSEGNLLVGSKRGESIVIFYNTEDSPNKTVPINAGEVNRLSVLVESPGNNQPTSFTYAINGVSFYTLEYQTMQEYQSKVGLIVWLPAADESIKVSFDNLIVQK